MITETPRVSNVPSFSVLGVRIDAVQIADVIDVFEAWIQERRGTQFVAVCNVHMVMEAKNDPRFMEMLNTSGLTVPDGKPLTWIGSHLGFDLKRRVYGPDLFQDFLKVTNSRKYRHFFYGGHPDVTQRMISKIQQHFPGTRIAGSYSPPFRELTTEENSDAVAKINESHADILWVGLGCPKQEVWMYEHQHQVNVPVMVGVGQAFNIVAGNLNQAPRWMREHGLEWLFRLLLEPRRLWKRYLVYNSKFIFHITRESFFPKK